MEDRQAYRQPEAVKAWLAVPGRRFAVTLKSLRFSAALTQETNAYSATIVVDGVPAFSARNAGTGGADVLHPLPKWDGPSPREIDDWLTNETPKVRSHGMDLDNCLEIVVSDLIAENERDKALRRILSRSVAVISKDDAGQDALYTYKAKPTPAALESMRAAIASGRVDGTLVNGDDAAIARATALV